MELVHEFDFQAILDPSLMVGPGPFGTRAVIPVRTAVQTMTAATGFDDQYFRIDPRRQTGDERYAWVDHTLSVGRGRIVPGAVTCGVFRVT